MEVGYVHSFCKCGRLIVPIVYGRGECGRFMAPILYTTLEEWYVHGSCII